MKKVLFILVALGVMASLLSAIPNEINGFRNRSVEIAVDFEEVRLLAEDGGLNIREALNIFKDAGVTAVGLREAAVSRYVSEGRLGIFQGGEILNALRTGLLENPEFKALRDEGRIVFSNTYIITDDVELARKLLLKLDVAFGRQAEIIKHDLPVIIEVKASRATVVPLPVGLEPSDIELLKNTNLRLVGRPSNTFMGSEQAVRTILAEYANLPDDLLSALVFDGVEAAGFPDHLDAAAQVLRDNDLKVGFVELVRRQSGIEELMRLTYYKGITVHSNIRGRPVASIVNAVMDRGVRLIYLRFHIERRPASLENATEFVSDLKEQLYSYGFHTGAPAPLGGGGRWTVLHILSIIGVVSAGLLAISLMGFALKLFALLAAAAGFAALTVLYAIAPDLSLQLSSILASLIFPVLAVLAIFKGHKQSDNKNSLRFAAASLLRMFAVALLGGILVAGLNSTAYFISGAALFRGVTLTNTLPFIPVAWIIYAKLALAENSFNLREVVTLLLPVAKRHVTWLSIAACSVFIVIAFIFVARLGHTAGMPVLPFEDNMRRLLDELLIVRPRTKEFLIAYPALVLGLYLYTRGRKDILTGVLLAIGALAPISTVNTFSHFTNPTILSSAALRSLNGLWIGTAVGLILVFFVSLAEKRLNNLRRLF